MILLNNIQMSGFSFDEKDANWGFKFKILNSIMLIAMFFSFLFALLHDLGINDIGAIHSKVDYFYSFSSLVLLLLLRRSKQYYTVITSIFLIITFCTFVSALVFVLNDEYRIIWFYFAIYIAYIFLGSYAGIAMTIATLSAIIISKNMMDLQISDTATYTAVLGLLIASLLSRIYTVQMARYEAQLKTKNNQLEQKVNELDIVLEQTQQASKAKSLFLASMSHEIRTPMNGVLGMVQVMRGTSLDEEQKHYIDVLDRSGKSLMLLIDDLLDLSKIESGKLELDIEPFEVFSWVTDIQNITEPLFENNNTVFITEVANDIPAYLEGDAARLLQITVNLISNAAKYTQDGEVRLLVTGQLTSESLYDLTISIEDTGQGIADEKLELIFEAFHQFESDRSANKGVGLGLAICKRLSDIMNGQLRVVSSPGKGSCFSFDVTLPVPDKHAQSVATEKKLKLNRKLSILLVDDDAINRLAARVLLEQAGQQVTEAENGQLAIEKIKTESFDVVLMDIHMPVMDGISATQVIREDKENQVPIIGLTASVMTDEKDRYLEAGMNAVVEKPIRIEKLMKAIQQLLNSRVNNR